MMRELHILGAAILSFSRLPLPFKVPYSKENMAFALTWFPLIGIIVGLIGACAWWILALVLPNTLALVLSMIVTILTTGAFHEDGFADICDGFGGGYTTEKKLAIMKDSCIGAYGAIGIVLMLLLKLLALMHLPLDLIFIAIIVAHSLSRISSIIISQIWDYVRLDSSSKSAATAKKLPVVRFVSAILIGVSPLYFVSLTAMWVMPLVVLISTLMVGLYFRRQIGGYTGDCLGACQQIIEVVIYLSFIIIS